MTKQPRDKNGRFVGKKEKWIDFDFPGTTGIIISFVVLCGLLIGYIGGDVVGYNRGYQTGLSDNQPTIYQNGFDAGKIQQKNIDELARNWTQCSWSWRDNVYCRNDNPNRVRKINPDYSTAFEYTMPVWTNDGCYR